MFDVKLHRFSLQKQGTMSKALYLPREMYFLLFEL
jgi:hypothetical protein